MPRALLLALAALAAPAASGQPVAVDSLPRRPPFHVPITQDFAPPQTSAARAYLYSAVATGGPILVGVLLNEVAPPSEDGAVGQVAVALVLTGAMIGPMAGNLSLGAASDVRRALVPKSIGAVGGAVLFLAGAGAGLLCITDALATGGECDGGAVTALWVTAGVVMAGGLVVGAAMDLATIPANAARARRYRQAHPRVTVAPGWRAGAPALGVRAWL